MNRLIKSPKITRGKGLRAVKEDEINIQINNDRNSAYTKLFDYYLSDQQQDKTLIRKLENHDYFASLLKDKKELQYMNMNLLAKVLLFLDSKEDTLFNKNPKSEILNYLNISMVKQNKNSLKTPNPIDNNKEVLDFFRYIRFVKTLMDNNKIENGEKKERLLNKAQNKEMIHPYLFEY